MHPTLSRTALAITAVLLVGAPASARAQTVHGTVRSGAADAVVAGAMVVLLDSTGTAVGGGFTDERGAFSVRAPRAGRYTLRVQRLGVRDVDSAPFELASSQVREQTIVASYEPLALPALTVEAQRQCVVRPGEGYAALAWAEARKSLLALVLTEQQGLYRFRVRSHDRQLRVPGLATLRDSTRTAIQYGSASPFRSVAVEQLMERGFIAVTDSGTFYFAPDAHVLLSDEFADAYCFGVASQRRDGLIGITFEPSQLRGPPGVRGTLWLDSETFESRHLEYRYTRATLPEGSASLLGGRVEFQRLPMGPWIVRSWYIRMPVMAERRTRPGLGPEQVRQELVALTETGGEVIEIIASSGTRADTRLQPVLAVPPIPATSPDSVAQAVVLDSIQVQARANRSAAEVASRAGGSRAAVLVRADIVEHTRTAASVADLLRRVQGLRVREFLLAHRHVLCVESVRSGGVTSGQEHCGWVAVVLDGIMITPPMRADAGVTLTPAGTRAAEQLAELFEQRVLSLPLNAIESIEYLSGAEGARYGTGGANGVLVIYTRGNGPHAVRR